MLKMPSSASRAFIRCWFRFGLDVGPILGQCWVVFQCFFIVLLKPIVKKHKLSSYFLSAVRACRPGPARERKARSVIMKIFTLFFVGSVFSSLHWICFRFAMDSHRMFIVFAMCLHWICIGFALDLH